MRQAVWLYQFAIIMQSKVLDMSFYSCWEYGLATIENIGSDWLEDSAEECVSEELSCWSD